MTSKPTHLNLKKVLIVIFFLILVAYGVYQTRGLILGPRISVFTPTSGASISSEALEIEGQAERIARLFLNGGQIFTDEEGHFKQKLLLAQGYNIIRLEARDKFGRTVNKVIEIVHN